MVEQNEMFDLSLESRPKLPEKECFSACIAYVEETLKGNDLEDLKKGDKFFNSSESLDDPCLNRPLLIKESLVAGAYAEVAVLLLKEIEHAPNNAIRDGWILPALFSMHQYLELIMKDSIRYFTCHSGECDFWSVPYPEEHNLQKLWNQLKPLIPQQDEKLFNIIFALLQDLDRISACSMAFRYPFGIGNDGNICIYQYMDRKYETINLVDSKTLLKRFLQLYRVFEGINALAQESSN